MRCWRPVLLLAIWFYFRSGIFQRRTLPEYKSLWNARLRRSSGVCVAINHRRSGPSGFICGISHFRKNLPGEFYCFHPVGLSLTFPVLFKDIFMADRFLGFAYGLAMACFCF